MRQYAVFLQHMLIGRMSVSGSSNNSSDSSSSDSDSDSDKNELFLSKESFREMYTGR